MVSGGVAMTSEPPPRPVIVMAAVGSASPPAPSPVIWMGLVATVVPPAAPVIVMAAVGIGSPLAPSPVIWTGLVAIVVPPAAPVMISGAVVMLLPRLSLRLDGASGFKTSLGGVLTEAGGAPPASRGPQSASAKASAVLAMKPLLPIRAARFSPSSTKACPARASELWPATCAFRPGGTISQPMSASGFHVLPQRGVLSVTGAEAAAFLDGLLTCATAPLAPGRCGYGALLTPQGKVIAELFLFAGPEGGILLDAPRAGLGDLAARLQRYRLRAKAEIADASRRWTSAQSFRADAAPPTEGALIAPDPRGPFGLRALLPATPILPQADEAVHHADRIALGLPEQGADYGPEEVFPADVGLDLLNGVDFAKGCFVGQEVVSRMRRRGTVRRRTVIAEADAPLTPGAPVMAGDSELGRLTSVAGLRALALIRIDRWAEAEGRPLLAAGVGLRLRWPDWTPPSARQSGEAP